MYGKDNGRDDEFGQISRAGTHLAASFFFGVPLFRYSRRFRATFDLAEFPSRFANATKRNAQIRISPKTPANFTYFMRNAESIKIKSSKKLSHIFYHLKYMCIVYLKNADYNR